MHKIILFVFLTFTFYYCGKEQKKTSVEIIGIPEPKEYNFSDIFNLHSVISLETTEESLFGILNQIEFTEREILILDQSQHKLISFDKNGKYQKKIESQGQGPEEYTSILSFTVDNNNDKLYIDDNYSSTINIYKLENFEFVKKQKLSFTFSYFHYFNEHFFFYKGLLSTNNIKNYDLTITDKKFNVLKEYFPYSFYNGRRGHMEKILNNNRGGIYYYTNYCDTIFEYNNYYLEPKYKIVFPKTKVPPLNFYEDRSHLANSKVSDEIYNGNYIYSYKFYDTKENIIIGYFFNKNHYLFFRDKITNQERSISRLIDDYGFLLDGRSIDFVYNDLVGFVIYPALFYDNLEKNPSYKVHPDLRNYNIEENPKLVLFKIKK